MQNTNTVKKNYIYNTIYSIFALIVPFITTPYVSRVLGANNIGEYSFLNSIVTYFTIAAIFGSTIYGQRKIAYVREDSKKISEEFWNVFTFRTISSFLILLLYFLNLILSHASIIGWLLSLNIINVILDTSWFYQGLEKFEKIAVCNFFVKIINCLLIFILVKSSSDLWVYVLIVVGSNTISALILTIQLKKYIKKPVKIKPFYEFKEMVTIFIPTVATQVYQVLDKSMIGWITSSNYQNGCYEQAEKIARISLIVVTSLGSVILPRVSNLFNSGDTQNAKKNIYLASRVTLLIGIPISFGLYTIAPLFIPIFLGHGYEDSVVLLQIFSVLVVFVGLANTIGLGYLIPTKQQNKYTMAVTISAAFNLLLNIVLIPFLGAIGAAISSVFAEGLGVTIQIVYCISSKQLELKSLFRGIWRYLVAGFLMCVIVSLGLNYINSIIGLSIMIFTGAVLYFVILVLLRDDFLVTELMKVCGLNKL